MDRPVPAGSSIAMDAARAEMDAMTEQQRAQQQLLIFQNSLPKVNEIAYQLLLNEIVPLAMSVENRLLGDQSLSTEDEKNIKQDTHGTEKALDNLHMSVPLDLPSHILCRDIIECDEEKQKRILERLRNIGFQTGTKVTELLVFSNNPNLKFKDMDLLSVMKFICRDVWKQMFGKQIDNLKTNHRGTFYLFDYEYRPIQSFSLDNESTEKELDMVKPFLEIPIGIIKGVLASLGYLPENIVCIATFVERPEDRPRATFHKGISFHVQVNMQ